MKTIFLLSKGRERHNKRSMINRGIIYRIDLYVDEWKRALHTSELSSIFASHYRKLTRFDTFHCFTNVHYRDIGWNITPYKLHNIPNHTYDYYQWFSLSSFLYIYISNEVTVHSCSKLLHWPIFGIYMLMGRLGSEQLIGISLPEGRHMERLFIFCYFFVQQISFSVFVLRYVEWLARVELPRSRI